MQKLALAIPILVFAATFCDSITLAQAVGGSGSGNGGLRSGLLLAHDDKAMEGFEISQRIIQIIQLSGEKVTQERFIKVLDRLSPSERQRSGARDMFEAMYEASQAVK